MVRIRVTGDYKKTIRFLENLNSQKMYSRLSTYGQKGVEALSSATPIDTGETAASWAYEVIVREGKAIVRWYNTNRVNGVPIALILQYGHATRNGGYVQGRDYINPAIQPIFDQMLEDVWKEVIRE